MEQSMKVADELVANYVTEEQLDEKDLDNELLSLIKKNLEPGRDVIQYANFLDTLYNMAERSPHLANSISTLAALVIRRIRKAARDEKKKKKNS